MGQTPQKQGVMAIEDPLSETRRAWDAVASSFDDEPDHGLRDPEIRRVWTSLLRRMLPAQARTVLDAGCGTGSLSGVLAGLGYTVTGIDLSPSMIERARVKAQAQGESIEFRVMDAGAPAFAPHTFDAIVCRHVLWSFPDPAAVLTNWSALLKPGGILLLIEGYWHTGSGLHASEIVASLPSSLAGVTVEDLSTEAIYWGKAVEDERFAILAQKC
jgi:SAM-dependent methyltransferase